MGLPSPFYYMGSGDFVGQLMGRIYLMEPAAIEW